MWGGTYSAHDVIVVGEMGLAVLASEDAVAVEVDVVGEAHCCRREAVGASRMFQGI